MTYFTGNISQPAVLREVKRDGVTVKVADFNVAENRRQRNGKTTTIFWRVTVWRNLAEKLTPYLTVGRIVSIEGDATCSPYIDKNGNAAATMEIKNPVKVTLFGKNLAEAEAFDGEAAEEE